MPLNLIQPNWEMPLIQQTLGRVVRYRTTVSDDILSGKTVFDKISGTDPETIQRNDLDKVEDINGQNVLFATVKIITELNLHFKVNKHGYDAFEYLPAELVKSYHELKLYLYIRHSPEIENITERFESNDPVLFTENPELIDYIDIDKFKDETFFRSICFVMNRKKAIRIAILYGYQKIIRGLASDFTDCFELDVCEGSENLSEDLIILLLKKNNNVNWTNILVFAYKKKYEKLFRHAFSIA